MYIYILSLSHNGYNSVQAEQSNSNDPEMGKTIGLTIKDPSVYNIFFAVT